MRARRRGADASAAGGAIAVGTSLPHDAPSVDAVRVFSKKSPSPVATFIERAKRPVAKDFLEVLADVAPDGLDQAKRVGGIRDE